MDERVLTPEGRAALKEELLHEVFHVDALFDLDDHAAAPIDEPAPTFDADAAVAELLASISLNPPDDGAEQVPGQGGMSPAARAVTLSLLAHRSRVVDSERWQDSAVCVIDPRATNAETPQDAARALAMCALCPVRVQCREWADSEPMFQGVAGGAVYGDNRAKTRKRNVA